LLWAQWWYVNDALVANLEHQRLASELTQVAETRYANGIGLQQDVLKVETHAIQLRHQHLIFEQEQRRLRAHINHLLNRPANTAIPAPSAALLTPELPSQTVLEDWVINHHPELKELQAESNVAMLNRRLTEKDDYPDMQFNVGYNELWNESALRLQVGVSLNIPLDFGKRSARKSAAQYEYHSVQMALQNKRSELRSELEVGLSEFDQSAHGIHLIETELLPSAEQTVNATLANYESGGGNFFELIDAQEQLLDMHLLLSNSVAEQYMALAELNQLTGGQLWTRGENQ
jgi:outer membrane protein TolC